MQGTKRRRDGDKNPRTSPVRPRSARQQDTPPAGARLAMLLMLGWLALLAWGAWTQRLPLWLLAAVAGLNLVTFFAYALDKSAAQRGAWRTPEQTLHLLALLGGWPAAWWAQQWLRHKSRKQAFRSAYWDLMRSARKPSTRAMPKPAASVVIRGMLCSMGFQR